MTTSTFTELGIAPQLSQHLASFNFIHPTPIQSKTIPILLSSQKDFVGLAPTGTGKTAAFGLPLIERLDKSKKTIQALVLSPTRELAIQVAQQLEKFGSSDDVKVATIYGGGSYGTQKRQIREGAQIVVATPGRLVDFLDRKEISLENVTTVILDEADEMVSRGFKEDLELILEATQEKSHPRVWLFSATMNNQVQKIAKTYLGESDRMEIRKDEGLSSLLEQYYCPVNEKNKRQVLLRIIQTQKEFYGVVFCEMKYQASEISRFLMEKGVPADAIHGDKTQSERERTLARFKKNQIQVLVATDVAARGLDIPDLTHVINFTLPWQVDVYTHRVGRTARNGKSGVAISLVSSGEVRDLQRIQKTLKQKMEEFEIPSQKLIILNKASELQQEILQVYKGSSFIEKSKQYLEEAEIAKEFRNLSAEDLLATLMIQKYKNLFYEEKLDTIQLKSERKEKSEKKEGGRGKKRSFKKRPSKGGGRSVQVRRRKRS